MPVAVHLPILHCVLGNYDIILYIYSKLPLLLPLPQMLECRQTTLRRGGSNCDGELGCRKMCCKTARCSLSAVWLFQWNGLYDAGEGEWGCQLGLITHPDCFMKNIYTETFVLFVLTSVGCNVKLFIDMVTIFVQAFV